ncbi:MAG TPA: AI-2E family transporter [Gammaproteobacteria bacterium]|nr:AI-2E family transporter [Gammaproteobacteria bacterium]
MDSRLATGAAVLVCGLLIYLLGPILTPFLVSALLAWIGDPAADRLEAWKFPRSAAVGVVFVATLFVLALILLLIVPLAARDFAALSLRVPQALAWFDATAVPWLAVHLKVDPARLHLQNITNLLANNLMSAGQFASDTLATVSHSSHAVFAFFMNLLLIPVVTYYLLRDWDIMKARVAALLPRDQAPAITRLATECEAVLAAFFRGQLLVMACLAIVYSLGLSIVGLDNAVAIGVIAGLLGFVPYLGIATGITLALLSALLQGSDPWLPLWVLLVFGLGHLLESFVLTPRLVGGRIGLHPVLVIFAILAGGELFGFVGVLLALPAAAAGTVFVRHARERYLQSDLYKGSSGGES